MNLYLRFIIVLVSSYFKPKITDILALQSLRFRVLPNDLDLNGHMNNGRYLSIMDLGRLDLILRTGIFRLMMRDKSIPVLSAAQMRFRVQLELWRRYDLETRIVCWDDKWIYMQQRFIILDGKKAGQTAAIGFLKGAFYNRPSRQTVPTDDLLDKAKLSVQSPAFPKYIQDWIVAENEMRDHGRALDNIKP